MRKNNSVVRCPICNHNCPKPIESIGPTSLSSSMAGIKKTHWVSKCKFLDTTEHQDAEIFWRRIQKNKQWTRNEINNFINQLENLRTKIG